MIYLLILWLWDRLDWNKSTGQKSKYFLWQIVALCILAFIMTKR